MSYRNRPLLDEFALSELNQDDSEDLIQLVSVDSEKEETGELPEELSILPIKNTVLFPGVVIPITVGRKKSIKLVKKAYEGDRLIGVIAQKNRKDEDPAVADLYKVGTVAKILKMLVLPDGNTTIIIQGKKRYKIDKILQEDPYLKAKVEYLTDKNVLKVKSKQAIALVQSLKDAATRILTLNPDIPQEAQMALDNIKIGRAHV